MNKLSVFCSVNTCTHSYTGDPSFWHWFSHSVRNCGYQELLEILVDPAHEVCDTGIHARELSLSTANTPAHNANLHPAALVDHQWPSAVALHQL